MKSNTHLIPALSDNYIYLIENGAKAMVVDPATSEEVVQFLQDQSLELTAILLTHHHYDHTGGVKKLKETFHCPVYGPKDERIPEVDHSLEGGEQVTIAWASFHIDSLPGHTSTHIAYYLEETHEYFCGDVLFSCGCGRLLEGSPAEMFDSLAVLKELPKNCKLYCGHEYTLKNLDFALTVEPNNKAIEERLAECKNLRNNNKPTIPTLLENELQCNPFLRCDNREIRKKLEMLHSSNLEVFTELRKRRDRF